MALIKDKVLTGRVDLDGNRYQNVRFADAQMVYSGGLPPAFTDCRFKVGCTLTFDKDARNTVTFLRSMAPQSTGMRIFVEGLIPELKT